MSSTKKAAKKTAGSPSKSTAKAAVKPTARKVAGKSAPSSKVASKKVAAKKATVKPSAFAPGKKIIKEESPRKASKLAKSTCKSNPKSSTKTVSPTSKTPTSRISTPPQGPKVNGQPSKNRVVQNVSEKSKKTTENATTATPTKGVVARAVFRDPSPKSVEPKKVKASPIPQAANNSAEDLLSIGDPGFLDATEVHDEGDHAQHQQLREQAAIQMRARALAKPESHPDFDGEHCVDCDVEIPIQRLNLGRVRCVDCQQFIEDKQKRTNMHTAAQSRFPEDW